MTTEHVNPNPDAPLEPEVDTDAAALAIDDGKGNKMVPLSALLGAKKELKETAKKLKDLEPIAAEATQIKERLVSVQPIIDAVITSPKLRAEAVRIAKGETRTSNPATEQPTEEDDPDAVATAEDLGLYLGDGITPDAARARRVLGRLDLRHGKQTDERIRPLAGSFLGSQAEKNVRHAMTLVDEKTGAPLASRESIEDTVKLMGGMQSPLLANPNVVDILINNAIGLDIRNNRRPEPVDEPLYLARQGGPRQPETTTVDADTRASLQRLGITEKDYLASSKRLEDGVANRKGIALGVK